MTMTPGLRKFALTSHVTSSVGWLGAVAAFLALAVAGLSSRDDTMVRAAYIAMHVTTWFTVHLSGTDWGGEAHCVVARLVAENALDRH